MTDTERAELLDLAAMMLTALARVFRGEEMDMTGAGLEHIAFFQLKEALDVKVVSKETWETMCKEKS